MERAVLSPAHNESLLIKAKRTMTLVIVLSISLALVIIFLFEQRVQESTSSQVFGVLGKSAGNVEDVAEVLIPKVKHWLVEQMKKSGYKNDNVSPLVDKLMHNISEEVQSISATPPHERYWDKENAIACMKGDKALFSRVCSLFAHRAPDKVKLLEKAIAHRDVDQARTLTLKLKGISSDIGTVHLQNDFEKL
ncbi:hypothetical protein [Alteromonas gracilis]|uniref:hypothetical protein n=1 Tax=Alteromonas gracilis TaxID=1479524 RepID=UPI0030CFC25E